MKRSTTKSKTKQSTTNIAKKAADETTETNQDLFTYQDIGWGREKRTRESGAGGGNRELGNGKKNDQPNNLGEMKRGGNQ